MYRTKSLLLVLTLPLLCLNGCSWLRGDYEGWVEFNGNGFSFMVPRAANGFDEYVYPVPGTSDVYQIKHDGDLYQVSRFLVIRPKDEREAEQALDAWRNGYISTLEGAQFISQRKVTLSGYTGSEIKLTSRGKYHTARCYIAASQAVGISVDHSTAEPPKDARLFLDSLVIQQ